MRSTYRHTRTWSFSTIDRPAIAVPQDALSAPTSDRLIAAGVALWPKGAAWGTPDGEAMDLSSIYARLTRVMLSPFEWLYARAYRLALQSAISQTAELIDEREEEYGLPDTCRTGDLTTEQRLAILRRKVEALPIATPEDFLRYAAEFGFTIMIEEPVIFECGFSECGGEHETGAATEETYWIFRVKDEGASYFECGGSECGYDPLFQLGTAGDLLCEFLKLAPAWTTPIVEDWIYTALLADETGRIISDIHGNTIAVVING